MGNAYTCRRLVDEAQAADIALDIVGVHDCYIGEQGVVYAKQPLARRDFVINRYKWGKLKDAINHLARRAYNPTEAFNTFINKYEQVKLLRSEAFQIPRYILSTSLLPYEEVAQLGSPVVAKGLESSMGQEIWLVSNEADYLSLRKEFAVDKEWLFEEFITSSYGRDLRLFSIRGNAVACMMRQAQTGFKANVALGAKVENVPINDTLRTIAHDIYKQTGLDFVGIDLLFGDDKYFLCEINVMPGLQGIEEASGVNIAGQIIAMIKADFENE